MSSAPGTAKIHTWHTLPGELPRDSPCTATARVMWAGQLGQRCSGGWKRGSGLGQELQRVLEKGEQG